jgi:hypothetical protein
LHIDKAALAAGSPAPLVIRTEHGAFPAREIRVLGPSVIVYHPESPLPPAGTYAWIETDAAIEYR